MKTIQQQLTAPFAVDDVSFRVGATTSDKKRGLALVYADSRAYQKRLDEVFGPAGWSCNVELYDAKTAIAKLTVTFPTGETVHRQSIGFESDGDAMSVEAKAFKRACSQLGLGRYLYDSPSPWADIVKRGNSYVFDDNTQVNLRIGFAKWQNERFGTTEPVPEVTKPQRPTNGNGDSSGSKLKPADEEVRIMEPVYVNADRPDWHGPAEAQQWAIQIGACKNEHEAIASWTKQVAEAWPNIRSVKPEQLSVVYDRFYARQVEKLQDSPVAV